VNGIAKQQQETWMVFRKKVADWTLASSLISTLISGALFAYLPAFAEDANGPVTKKSTEWITLGTAAGPLPNKGHSQPANVLKVNGTLYLVDAGNGVAGQLAKAGLDAKDIGTIFISHNHNDHNADMGTIMGVAWTSGRNAPTTVYGPPGTRKAIDGFLQFYSVNAEIRRSEQTMLATPEQLFLAKDIDGAGLVYKDANIKVTAVENTHYHFRAGSSAEGKDKSYSFRFETPDEIIVYTGDTGPSEAVTKLAHAADILVSEVANLDVLEAFLTHTPAWLTTSPETQASLIRHFREDHITPEEVGKMAAQAGVKKVVLTHLLPAVPDQALQRTFVDGVKKYYSGPVVVATDLMSF
jgi:ribonuclease BN (tRNA processing enzyme)